MQEHFLEYGDLCEIDHVTNQFSLWLTRLLQQGHDTFGILLLGSPGLYNM